MSHGDFSGWMVPNAALQAICLTPHARGTAIAVAPKGHLSTSGTSGSSSSFSTKTPVAQQTCFNFNCGTCKTLPCPTGRLHKCQSCGADDYSKTDCTRSGVSTPLVLQSWSFFLRDYPDCTFVSSLLNIVEHGTDIGFVGPNMEHSCSNLRSAFEDSAFMDAAVAKLVDNAQVHGPFPTPPLPDFFCSPLGAISKKHDPGKH
ncbi:hypothetical protein JR316_0004178 [Psilocybe cubensis]|uniref:Uncharacterized protein n=1 Tax=Psilocybe cubensis TaxID=181762 RepID=A0ACB8H2R9_PSICU|nr:hypothetical protein JR316_0004178 [Psilocybe cubensis]KAH9482083.1 hypothetical protein JR316_0004178 [Psilocybe cubensis]